MHPELQLFKSNSGKLSARVALSPTQNRHLHSMVDPQAEADYYADQQFWGDTIVFLGIGLGYHLGQRTTQINGKATVIAIDYFEECLEHCKETLFKTIPNTVLYLSSKTTGEEIEKIVAVAKCSAGAVQIVRHPASYSIDKSFYDTLCQRFVSIKKTVSARGAAIKKALLFHGGYFCENECEHALQERGVEPVLFKYKDISFGFEYESHLQKYLQRERPDFILSINMKGFDGNGALGDHARRYDIPIVVWFVDDPHPIVLGRRGNVGNSMIAFTWEKMYLDYLGKLDFKQVSYLPLAAGTKLFYRPEPATPQVPLGFVGTCLEADFFEDIRSKFMWNESLQPLVDCAAIMRLENPSAPVSGIVKQALNELNIPLKFSDERNVTWLTAYIIHNATMRKRKEILKELLPLGIELFGDPKGWNDLFGDRVVTHPDVDYSHELVSVYRSIAINLNMTSSQMPTAVNQRVFDIPLAGAFLLSDHQPDMDGLFELGKEAVCYENVQDLKEKILFYQKNEKERNKVIEAGQKKVLNEHTYNQRIDEILKVVKIS